MWTHDCRSSKSHKIFFFCVCVLSVCFTSAAQGKQRSCNTNFVLLVLWSRVRKLTDIKTQINSEVFRFDLPNRNVTVSTSHHCKKKRLISRKYSFWSSKETTILAKNLRATQINEHFLSVAIKFLCFASRSVF